MSAGRDAIITEQHLLYLDDLRKSAITNMFGAGPYLVNAFGVTRQESHIILNYWMHSTRPWHAQKEGE